jgi:prepilin-type N-terminal cleavage/methylation domain-containing protein
MHNKYAQLRSDSGFSLVELLVTIAMVFIISGFAVICINPIQVGMRADKAMYQIVDQLRTARETAVAQRRAVEIRFPDNDTIQLVRMERPNGETVLSTVQLTHNYQFILFGGIPDTPDTFRSVEDPTAVDFGGEDPVTFISDGTLVDSQGSPLNGSIFLGLADHPESARAVTVMGATGRVQNYRWLGGSWAH